MLAVAEINYIRHEANQKGRSYQNIAKRMNRDPRTVKKYAEMEEFDAPKVKQKRKARVIDRLIHHSHLIIFKGDSYRYKDSISQNL